MNNIKRQQQIIKLLDEYASLSVDYFADLFNVTKTTIRRDLNNLEKNNYISRSRGYASKTNFSNVIDIASRTGINQKEKNAIANLALQFVSENEILVFDSGTTTHELAKHLIKKNINNLTTITNSIPIAVTLSSKYRVIMPAGIVQNSNMSLIGPETDEYFEGITSDKLFLGATGVRNSLGLTASSPFHISLKKHMIKSATQVIALIDSTKFENNAAIVFCSFENIDILITTKTSNNQKILEEIISKGVKVILTNDNDTF